MDTIDRLVDAIRSIHSPTSSHLQRVESHQIIETFRELTDHQSTIDIAFTIIENVDNELCVRHVGWKLIEDVIKYKWNELSSVQRCDIRNRCFDRIASIVNSEHVHIKEAIARCITAMIEQEWPQNWPELIDDCKRTAGIGAIPCQLIIMTLHRLVEDVITMTTIENVSRRRELNNSIVDCLHDMLQLALNTLQSCTIAIDQSDCARMLARSALGFVAEIVEWSPARVMETSLQPLLSLICVYLQCTDMSINDAAAKCLWQLASRKKCNNEEAFVIMALFADEPMQAVMQSASLAAECIADERKYRFLKTLCSMLSSLGQHLTTISGVVELPYNFSLYLNAILAFFNHPSLYLKNEAAAVIVTFTSHTKIGPNADLDRLIAELLILIPSAMEKIGLPSQSNSITCAYSRLDYDSDVEFNREFNQFRDRCTRIVRDCMVQQGEQLLKLTSDWIRTRAIANHFNVRDTEWDAMNRFVRVVCDGIAKHQYLNTEPYRHECSALLDAILITMHNLFDWNIINNLLSTLSSFFIVLNCTNDRHCPAILAEIHRILFVDNIEMDDDKLKSTKRHAISDLLRLVVDFLPAVLPYGSSILELANSCTPKLTLMQRASLMQVLAVLSNYASNHDERLTFLRLALSDSVVYLQSDDVVRAGNDPLHLIIYIGLTVPAPITDIDADRSTYVQRRRDLRGHLSMIEGILQHVNPATSIDDNNTTHHPAFNVIRPLLAVIFSMARSLNGIYDEAIISRIHPSYNPPAVVDISDNDKQQILSSESSQPSITTRRDTSAFDHARCFIGELVDHLQTIIGLCIVRFGVQFYSLTESSHLIDCTYATIDHVPDYRIRFWIKRVWNVVCASNIPSAYIDLILPMIAKVTAHMLKLLGDRWNQIVQRLDATELDQNADPSIDDLFLEDMTCVLTRQHTLLLKTILCSSTSLSEPSENNANEDGTKSTISGDTYQLGQLGQRTVQNEEIMQSIVSTLFNCLTWRDTQSVVRIIPLCKLVTEVLCDQGKLNADSAQYLMLCTLQSLPIHGDDEVAIGPLLGLCHQMYSILRPTFPSLRDLLRQVPECSDDLLNTYDSKVVASATRKDITEKMKRDMIRRLVNGIIGKSIGVQFKRPVHLRQLPPLKRTSKRDDCNMIADSNDDDSDLIGIAQLFQPSSTVL